MKSTFKRDNWYILDNDWIVKFHHYASYHAALGRGLFTIWCFTSIYNREYREEWRFFNISINKKYKRIKESDLHKYVNTDEERLIIKQKQEELDKQLRYKQYIELKKEFDGK